MRILHVITGMRKAAGTSVFVGELSRGQVAKGHAVDIVHQETWRDDIYPLANGVNLIAQDDFIKTLPSREYDIIHVHGLWSRLLHKAKQYAITNHIPIVWSTHGMTAPWSMRHKWWKKQLAWRLYQKDDLKRADVIHCTTEIEAKWNQKYGLERCIVVPLGTKIPTKDDYCPIEKIGRKHTLLFVGRIYPVKGLQNLVKAWSLCNVDGWQLRIVGPDQAGHRAELERLVHEFKLEESVKFLGPRFGIELGHEYENCDCLVLPSFTENFGVTVVDALSHGKPCIASIFTPWQELKDRGCGWWVSNEPTRLANAIREMIDVGDVGRHNMGMVGRSLVEEKYTWNAVVKAMIDVYAEVLNGRA